MESFQRLTIINLLKRVLGENTVALLPTLSKWKIFIGFYSYLVAGVESFAKKKIVPDNNKRDENPKYREKKKNANPDPDPDPE